MLIKGKERKLIFYDVEVYKHLWMVKFIEYETRNVYTIINDKGKLERFYNNYCDDLWIGFNNGHYDDYIIKGILLDYDPKWINDQIISENKSGWEIIHGSQHITLLTFDLIILNTSLKQCEGFMGESIIECSVPWDLDRPLTKEEINEVRLYNIHDVEMTIRVFENSKASFEGHRLLIEEFNLPISAFSKTKARLTSIVLGAKPVVTHDEFDYKLPSCLKIGRFQHILDWFNNPINKWATKIKPNGVKEKNYYKTDIMGLPCRISFGGLHASNDKFNRRGFYVHSDVSSLYPSLIIEHDLMSRAVTNKEIYPSIKLRRIELKKTKDPRQLPLKLILNSTYGIHLDKYSTLYDPNRARSICIVGQLLLLDLIDKIEDWGKGTLIQVNTDKLSLISVMI